MTTYMHFEDAIRSPEMRHEVAEPVMDPVIFFDHDGRRIIVCSTLELATFKRRDDVLDEVWDYSDFGLTELARDESFPTELMYPELVRRAVGRTGVKSVVVPPTFRLHVGDYLREHGIEVIVDTDAWVERRRRKTPWEIEGIERAQRATDTAMLTARRMLREAEQTSEGKLRFEGEILTAELIRDAMQSELLAQGAESEEIIVACGDVALNGHDIGSGPILPDHSVVIDCFPRDRKTGMYTDMTRTYVAGAASDELRAIHKACIEAMDLARPHLVPGSDVAHKEVSEFFHGRGYPTRLHDEGSQPMVEGFPYSLGHGVGLQVHERPYVGMRAEPLQEGDVVAVEPGLYFAGVGGVRIEDTVLIGPDGVEYFTEPLPYDLEP
jgi:Xaa-Pro aminopeptidase